MKVKLIFLVALMPVLALNLSLGIALAQGGYTLVGTARGSAQSDCYQLTAAQNGQNGAVWYDEPLRLTESFELEFTMNFGSNPRGADGIVMVMQTKGNRILGVPGQGMGFLGLQPALGIEFDTHRNGNLGDPEADHIAVVRDGESNHRTSGFAAPVPISTASGNVKDGKNHLIRVKWDAVNQILQVFVDCNQRISQPVKLIQDIFKGRQEVFWGFTSSTGSSANAHTVCLQKEIVMRDTLPACRGEVVGLVANKSFNDRYEWRPAVGLDNPNSRTPQLTVANDQLYTVTYTDQCSNQKTDSVFVRVKTPKVNLGADRSVCEGTPVELNPTLAPEASGVQFKWSTGETARAISPTTSGLYTLEVVNDGCADRDSVQVTFEALPKSEVPNEQTIDCPGAQPLVLDPRFTGTDLTYEWVPGAGKGASLEVTGPGTYSVTVRTPAGCAAERKFVVLDNCPASALVFVPDAFSPNGDGQNEVFEWKSTENIEVRLKIFNRWGELIFSNESGNAFWNGTSKGVPCPENSYLWKMEYKTTRNATSQWITRHGQVLLVR
ncbi:lectin-like domain-containing protein [Larkinella soli]|uniref:lectin-like domain-containing protein n=1 Tax=Larkinella soli TaxID=1770527 RepID=UPI000FFB84F1|nr:gliding motility-associated C-terminal domain-containing protein [Larkinella soli]